MHRDGNAPIPDDEKEEYYLKMAADMGDDIAMIEYGVKLIEGHLSNSKYDATMRDIGLRYIRDSNDILSEHKYNFYKNYIKNYIKVPKRKKAIHIMFWIGEIIFLLGTLYLFKGLNPDSTAFISTIPDMLIIKWDGLVDVMAPYMTVQGIFGGWLIILGNLFKGLGYEEVDITNNFFFCAWAENCLEMICLHIINILLIVICVAHFVYNVRETANFFGNGSYMQFVVMIGCTLVSRFVGRKVYTIMEDKYFIWKI